MRAFLAGTALLLSGCTTTGHWDSPQLEPGARYVAMGSSYAAGAWIGPLVPDSAKRCGRTQNNYAHLMAEKMGLDLIDVSCGGATTAHIVEPWSELPPQIDAVTLDTRLVTVTIGGNDLNYVPNLMIATCGRVPGMMPLGGRACPAVEWPVQSDYQALEKHLHEIAEEVRKRAPQARLVFVDYLRIVPDTGGCIDLPLDAAQMSAARATLERMAEITKKVAGAEASCCCPQASCPKAMTPAQEALGLRGTPASLPTGIQLRSDMLQLPRRSSHVSGSKDCRRFLELINATHIACRFCETIRRAPAIDLPQGDGKRRTARASRRQPRLVEQSVELIPDVSAGRNLPKCAG